MYADSSEAMKDLKRLLEHAEERVGLEGWVKIKSPFKERAERELLTRYCQQALNEMWRNVWGILEHVKFIDGGTDSERTTRAAALRSKGRGQFSEDGASDWQADQAEDSFRGEWDTDTPLLRADTQDERATADGYARADS